MYLSNLVYGVPLEQAMPIVSESGDIQGNLSINIQQCTGIDSVTFTISCYTKLGPFCPQVAV